MELHAFARDLAAIKVPWIQGAYGEALLPDDAVWIGCTPPPGQAPAQGLVLDNEGGAAKHASATRLVAGFDERRLADWPLWARRPVAPQQALSALTLVVEDASPDSTWALIVLLARLAGCDLSAVLPAWLAIVEAWEASGNAEQPESEWPCLASALVHSQFGAAPGERDAEYRNAWTLVLRFAGECLLRGVDPAAIGAEPGLPLLRRARAMLQQEAQTYEEWLPHAHVLQLSLPMAGTNERRRLVDALIFVEDQPTGMAKVIYRNDRVNAPLRQGFTFAASRRPGSPRDSGNDVTITVDPRRQVHLRELWEELERLETAKWGGKRPCGKPRDARLGPYNQPWYVTEDFTLVAAPHAVQPDPVQEVFEPGSRLDWAEVMGAIWRLFSPLRDVSVTTLAGVVTPLLLLPPEPCRGSKVVRAAVWPEASSAPDTARSLGSAPIFDRTMAAMTLHADAERLHDIGVLPAPGSWVRVPLPGGFAIVTGTGAFLLDDWREFAHPPMSELRDLCCRASALDEQLRQIEVDEIAPLAKAFAAALASAAPLTERPRLALVAARLGVRLTELRGQNLPPSHADALLLRETLDRVWGVEARLAGMERQVKAVADSLKALGDAQMRRLGQFVALIGFPFYLAAGLAKPAAVGLIELALLAGWWSTPFKDGQEPPTWTWWVLFTALFVLAVLAADAMRRWDSANERGSP